MTAYGVTARRSTACSKLPRPCPQKFWKGAARLKRLWEKSVGVNAAQPVIEEEVVYHPKWKRLRATMAITHLDGAGLTPPHFLVQCEELRDSTAPQRTLEETRLPHLARLTLRQQEVTRLPCEGRSNQEIADETGLRLQMVKKHLHTIFRKLEVASRSRLMALMR